LSCFAFRCVQCPEEETEPATVLFPEQKHLIALNRAAVAN
jgi:hypothetical protein